MYMNKKQEKLLLLPPFKTCCLSIALSVHLCLYPGRYGPSFILQTSAYSAPFQDRVLGLYSVRPLHGNLVSLISTSLHKTHMPPIAFIPRLLGSSTSAVSVLQVDGIVRYLTNATPCKCYPGDCVHTRASYHHGFKY